MKFLIEGKKQQLFFFCYKRILCCFIEKFTFFVNNSNSLDQVASNCDDMNIFRLIELNWQGLAERELGLLCNWIFHWQKLAHN